MDGPTKLFPVGEVFEVYREEDPTWPGTGCFTTAELAKAFAVFNFHEYAEYDGEPGEVVWLDYTDSDCEIVSELMRNGEAERIVVVKHVILSDTEV